MAIVYSEATKEFHIHNDKISYILQVMPNGEMGNLYFGKRIKHKDDFSYLVEGRLRSLAVYNKENDYFFSQQYSRMEYPGRGTGDFREPAYQILQQNGSLITHFEYESHKIYEGKKKLPGLPATYVEQDDEAESLEIHLYDRQICTECVLNYTIFRDFPAIARSVRFQKKGMEPAVLTRVLSASIDLPDADYEMIQLSGAWSRERSLVSGRLRQGVQGVGSCRGISSAEHNPFIALKRPQTNERTGEVIGCSLIYSGNHLEQVEVDTNNTARIQIGIHPEGFSWRLGEGEEFQSPEAVIVYSEQGMNGMSQVFHKLYRTRLVRGKWRDRERPVLINNWEATGVEFTEEKLLQIAKTGKELGMELFVMDDGWFGGREDDKTGLGDWFVKNREKLPEGITGIASKVESMGMHFGLWFEPEMVNKDSDLYKEHPDWILCPPDRTPQPSRNQYILDFSRPEVIDTIFEMMDRILGSAPISYVKWDMNRYMTDCYSATASAEEQGKVRHKYILGVYSLYERLIRKYPDILFESCSSGGARFDPGMLYYAPQTWTSDDTDAMERIKIQYGTSYIYPLSAMGAHVSAVPNQQVGRETPLQTRGNVAVFGMLGYELDLSKLTNEEKETIRKQIQFYQKYRWLIMQGTFYRLLDPFQNNDSAWMVVSEDQNTALIGFYRRQGVPNGPWIRLYLDGLDENRQYYLETDGDRKTLYGGDELMHVGMVVKEEQLCNHGGDCSSEIFVLQASK